MRYALLSIFLLCTSFVGASNQYTESIVDNFNQEEMGRGENLARVTFADERVNVKHEGMDAPEDLVRNMPVLSGDFVNTGSGSYAEVEFIDGSRMQFADRTQVEFQAINEVYAGESLTVLKLYDGSLFLHSSSVNEALGRRVIRIDTASGSAYVEAPGIYRVDMENNRMRLRVYRGFAELSGEDDSRAVYSGEYATIRDMRNPSRARNFNSFRADRFERWAYSRRPSTSVSGKYVDASLSAYASDLDGNGTWQYDEGVRRHVWIPRVSAGWAPYRNGFWYNAEFRMTWISGDPWGYITHHYGRWMYSSVLGWYWCPGSYYSPAWVAWSTYGDYLGWCPLGYWDEPWYYYGENRHSYFSSNPRVRIRNTVVVNNYWNYVPASEVVNRRRSYSTHRVAVTGNRRITTRPLHINRRALTDPSRLTRVISDPSVNRRRADERRSVRVAGSILQSGTRTGVAATASRGAVRIESRSTGTTAPSRFASSTRRTASSSTSSRAIVRTSTPERRTTRTPRATTEGRDDRSRTTARVENATPTRRSTATSSRTTTSSRATTSNRGSSTVKRTGTATRTPSRRDVQSTAPRRSTTTTRSSTPNRSRATSPARTSPPKRQYNSGGSSRSNSAPKATRSSSGSSNRSYGSSSGSRSTVTRSSSGSKSSSSATRSSGSSRSSSTRSSGTTRSSSSRRGN